MKTFSTLLTVVCIGLVLMLAGNAAAQEYRGSISPLTDNVFAPDDTVDITVQVESITGTARVDGITFRFSATPSTIATFSPNPVATGSGGNAGKASTTMTIASNAVQILTAARRTNFQITAFSRAPSVTLITTYRIGAEPTKIVVLPPNSPGLSAKDVDLDGDGIDNDVMPVPRTPKDLSKLAVGDTFSQQIWIKDVHDLSAWQMDIAFNPAILKAVNVTEGDFLAVGGYNAFWTRRIDNGVGKITARQARVGRRPNSSPPLVASPPGVNETGKLLTIEFEVLEFAEESLGLHNVQLSNSRNDRISYYSVINPIVVTHKFPPQDVNRDGTVDILDLVVVAGSIGQANPINPRADVNDDGIINVLDLVTVYQDGDWGNAVSPAEIGERSNAFVGAAPAASVGNITPETIQGWINLAHMENDGSLIFKRGIANLEHLLHKVPIETRLLPSETKLLRNYPNPFNPETWIPYQLTKSAEVTLNIYAVDGTLIRTLALGHQPAGLYQNRSRAAYWDGRDELGMQVTSGIYFYTLTAGDFSATRRMVIAK